MSYFGYLLPAEKEQLDKTSGTNTGDQTCVTGNSGTATRLETTRYINGVAFDGTTNITIYDNTKEIAGVAATADGAHLAAFVHGDIAHANRAALNLVSGTNTGDQTTISGNSGSATKLITSRTINGVAFDGTANITVYDSTKEVAGVAATADAAHLAAFAHGDIAHANRAALNSVSGINTGDQAIPTTLPASDVYAWAKQAAKPAYTAAEVGLGNVTNESKQTMFTSPIFSGIVQQSNRIDSDITIPDGINAVMLGDFEVGPDVTVTGLGNSTWRGL